MHDGCRFNRLYTIGIIATMPCGGADKDNRERRLINDATRAAGRYLVSAQRTEREYTMMKGKGLKAEESERDIDCGIEME